jgi:hypothetical protein
MRRVFLTLTAIGMLAATVLPAGAGSGGSDLGKVRGATAQFHRIDNVVDAGYQLGYIAPFLLNHCIAHPTEGGMGFHYFNHDMIHDTELDPLRPEAMVYAPGPEGQLQLAAVEWIVEVDAWEAAGNTEPPVVLGQEMHILNPALGWYILHAWVWKHNPSGMFQDWNPEVVCD